ncbi:hypothetical protein [Arthrobacter sp. MA-N2]|uniref:hypothetical protein n=1 Tax=Arthrobacter sp. MA-N2 TaxID=1101188 RepID=UPI000480751A|nr:hypothetical protein [Arthrobacter sp. MA-N2]
MTEKIRLLVKMDIDSAQIRITAQGHLTSRSLHELYGVVSRANTLMQGASLEIDVSGARVDASAMEALRRCSQSHHLPYLTDSRQSEVNFSIRSSADAVMAV